MTRAPGAEALALPHPPATAGDGGPEWASGPSLALQSVGRLTTDVGGFVLGIVAAVITSRYLGPADKGTYSTLAFMGATFGLVCTVGLGEAAVVELNRRRQPLARVLPATVAGAALAGGLGAILLWLVLRVQFAGVWDRAATAALLFALTVPLITFTTVLAHVLNARGRVLLTSAVAFTIAAATTGGLAIFMLGLDLSLTGGGITVVVAGAIGVATLLYALRGDAAHLRPRWDWAYLKRAVRYGAVIQLSYLLVTLTGRVDLVVVYALAGERAAGIYSVALTLGTLVAFTSLAMMYAAFPRLAGLEDAVAAELTARLFRVGVATAGITAVVLAALLPVTVPVFFGSSFEDSVTPTWILLPGTICFSGQVLLARARAARGWPGLLIWSFGTNLGLMLLLDFLLVPKWGSEGAAWAATLGSAAGLAVCLAAHRRAGGRLADLWPRGADVLSVLRLPRDLRAQLAARSSREGSAE
jgi:O-antigen/teichoic acid export membrane protein